MKKTFSILLALALGFGATSTALAQDNGRAFYKQSYESRNSGSFDHNTSLVSIGYGFPNTTLNGSWDNGFGPIYGKYEHGIIDEVGIGGYLGLAAASHSGPAYKDHYSAFGMGVLGYYHFNKLIPVHQLDVYAGAGLGFVNGHYKYDDHSPYNISKSYFDVNAIFKVGARWYFTQGFGVYLESGYDDMSSVNLGVTFRF